MSSPVENGRPLEAVAREATAWFVRLNNPLATENDRRAFRDWVDGDPAHAEAMHDVQELWDDLGAPAAVLAEDGPPLHSAAPVRPAGKSARLAFGVALVAALGCAVAFLRDPGILDRAFADHATRPGQRIEATLPDGSTIELDGGSVVSETFADNRRAVTITRGRVWFDVAPDAARPFVVRAGSVEVRVVGTAFAIDAESGTVVVERGLVDVASGKAELRLQPGQKTRAGPDGLAPVADIDPAAALGWRRGLIVLDAETVGDVVDELARAAPGRVMAPDAAVRAMRLSGVFRSDDPGAVIDAMRASLGLKTVSLPGVATLIYR